MATVRVRIVILTVQITLSVRPFNRMAHTANSPFLGLGGPRLFSLALVLLLGSLPSHRCSARNLWPRLGSPSWLLGLALVLLLGSSPRSHDSVLRPRVGSPPWLLGLALLLILGPIPRPRRCSSVPFFGPIPWRCFSAPHETLGCAPVPRSRCSSLVPTGPTVLRTKPSLLRSSASVLPSGKFLI
jgi:hypothetical protein